LFPFPNIDRQKEIVSILDSKRSKSKTIERKYQLKIDNLDDLKKSLLQKAFSGELTKNFATS